MTQTVERRVGVSKTVASSSFCVSTLQDAHLIGEVSVCEVQHTADTRGPVGTVGLKLTARERNRKALALFQTIVNGVGLITVGHDQVVVQLADRVINNQGRILHLGRIEGFRLHILAFLHEDTVAAVLAAAHDKVSHCSLRSVLGLADHNTATGVSIVAEQIAQLIYCVDVHIFLHSAAVHGIHSYIFLCLSDNLATAHSFAFAISAHTFSVDLGKMIHSACSITRLCSTSGVSPSSISTAFCMMIFPPSGISFT